MADLLRQNRLRFCCPLIAPRQIRVNWRLRPVGLTPCELRKRLQNIVEVGGVEPPYPQIVSAGQNILAQVSGAF